MSDPKAVRKGGFGAFSAMERERKAARDLANRAVDNGAIPAETVTVIPSEPISVPWPRPYSLRADADGDVPRGADGSAP